MFTKYIFLFIFSTISALQNIDFLNHYETLEMSDIHDISPPKPTRGKRSYSSFHNMYAREMTKRLTFTLFKRTFVLNMILDTDTLNKDAVFIESRTNISYQKFPFQDTLWLYKAFVKDEPKDLISQVTLTDQDISATIITRNETYFIDSLNSINTSLPPEKLFTYRLSDVKDQQKIPGMGCKERSLFTNSSSEKAGNASKRSKRGKRRSSGKMTCSLALAADVNFYRAMGRSNLKYTFKFLINLIAKVNAIFSNTLINDQKGYHLEIQQLKVMTVPNTPEEYNVILKNYDKKLYDLVMENNLFDLDDDNLFAIEHLLILFTLDDWDGFCLAHLFTHNNFGSTVGLAFSGKAPNHGGICDRCTYKNRCTRVTCLNAGVTNTYSQTSSNSPKLYHITAHELGHNFGAVHDPIECMLSKEKGGYFLMHTYSNTGRERNNNKFSKCSIKSMEYLMAEGKDRCFKEHVQYFCGNGVVEGWEECDEGNSQQLAEIGGICCTRLCKLKEGAECSPYNSLCCDNTCRAKSQGYRCREANNQSCANDGFCDGVSHDCPNPTWKPNYSTCLNQGFCLEGSCVSRCAMKHLEECQCNTTGELCVLCCKDADGCEPYLESSSEPKNLSADASTDNSTRYIYLEDNYPCINGHCFKRECLELKKHQMISARAWDAIPIIETSYTLELIRNNIVFLVFFIVLFFYVFICFFICLKDYIDQINTMKLRAWYSLDNDQLFAEGSTVKIINLEEFQRKYPKK